MSETRSPWEPDPATDAGSAAGAESRPAAPSGQAGEDPPAPEFPLAEVEPLPLRPLLPRRQNPWLIVEVDGSPSGHGALVWALREAARREATVVAVHVLDHPDGDPLEGSARVRLRTQLAACDRLEAHVLRAIAETGVQGRARTAVLERPVFDALVAATRGADLVVVDARGKSLLRQAVPRPTARRFARGA